MHPALIVLIVALIAAAVGFFFWLDYKRKQALPAWAAANGLTCVAGKDREFEHRFPEFKCLRQGRNRYARNIMDGEMSGRRVTAFDYHYETHSTNAKGQRQTHHHSFSAVVVDSPIPLKPLFIRTENLLDKIGEFVGLDDIDFESAEFSKKFYVKADDRRWAYDVLHTRAMQHLLDSPRFSIQFASMHAIAYRGSKFDVADFEAGIAAIRGLLDQLPDYVVRQQKGES